MYQFYYADKSKEFTREQCRDDVRNHFKITAIRPAMWEEHCLECSAPLCFESCNHFQKRSDGRCKRFENGLYTFKDEKACCGEGAHLKFRQWGNMMTVVFPAMISEEDYISLKNKNESLGNNLKRIESSSLPVGIRWQLIRIPEFLRRRKLRSLSTPDNKADAFIFHGYSYTETSYNLILEIYDDHTPVFKTSIRIQKGENLSVIGNLSDECSKANNLVKIYPENNIDAELDILWCDFVQGTPLYSKLPSEKVKCVVWDLDGTLWNGVLIETDEPNKLVLKEGILDTIIELDRRGIIQSIASKNDNDSTVKVLENLGISEYFLYPQINWNAKSDSVARIAKYLNIGIDSIAFVDDTIFERNQVKDVHPQVRTYDASDANLLVTKPEFDVPITDESKNRRLMYRAEEKRNSIMESSSTDIIEFLRKCELKVHVFEPSSPEEKLRCFELVVRTNQLNMSGIKYSEQEFEAVLSREKHVNFAFSCEDNFGSYGIVGFGQYKVEDRVLMFTEFAMSCRVAGKFVESALFAHLLQAANCKNGDFSVIKTKKNILLRNSLENIGFKTDKEDGNSISYNFDADLKNKDIVSII